MSMIGNTTGKVFAPGYFLAYEDEKVVRVTKTIPADHAQAVTVDGGKYVPAGAIFPSNDANAIGILYEDVDVSKGSAMGSVVTKGTVYKNRLPAAPVAVAASAMTGIKVVETEPTTTRPY